MYELRSIKLILLPITNKIKQNFVYRLIYYSVLNVLMWNAKQCKLWKANK